MKQHGFKITGAGVAITLAVLIAMAFLFFGKALFAPFSYSQAQQDTAGTQSPFGNTMTTGDTQEAGGAAEAGGLQVSDEVVGTGAEVKMGDTIQVTYVGAFTNGEVFDASANHGDGTFTFTVGSGVIEGWSQGVIGMKVGGTRLLSVPSELGYGSNDYGPIPGGSTLLFKIELLKVQ